jgi:tetratricopeptide (TPR) repeat protein
VLDLVERLTAPVSPGDQSALWAGTVYQALAQVMAEHRWTREQEQALRRGLTFVPDHTDLLYSLAHLLAFRKDADGRVLNEAIKLATKAADVVPVRSEYWRVLARAHFKAREYQLAAEAVGKSLKLESENGQTSGRLLMSMIRYDQGQHADAKAWYVAALDRQVNHADNDPDVPTYFEEAKELLKPILVADRPAADPGR